MRPRCTRGYALWNAFRVLGGQLFDDFCAFLVGFYTLALGVAISTRPRLAMGDKEPKDLLSPAFASSFETVVSVDCDPFR